MTYIIVSGTSLPKKIHGFLNLFQLFSFWFSYRATGR